MQETGKVSRSGANKCLKMLRDAKGVDFQKCLTCGACFHKFGEARTFRSVK